MVILDDCLDGWIQMSSSVLRASFVSFLEFDVAYHVSGTF